MVKWLIPVIVVLVIVGGVYFLAFGGVGGSVKVVEENNGDIRMIYKLNEGSKKANVEVEISLEDRADIAGMDEKSLLETMTKIDCRVFAALFFDRDNYIDAMKELDSDFEMPENYSLAGYEVEEAKVSLINKGTNKLLSKCVITGPDEEDRKIDYYI